MLWIPKGNTVTEIQFLLLKAFWYLCCLSQRKTIYCSNLLIFTTEYNYICTFVSNVAGFVSVTMHLQHKLNIVGKRNHISKTIKNNNLTNPKWTASLIMNCHTFFHAELYMIHSPCYNDQLSIKLSTFISFILGRSCLTSDNALQTFRSFSSTVSAHRP